MKLEFLDMQEEQNPLNGSLIDSEEELGNILDQSRHREPFGLKLEGENGFTMDILLAREFGSLQYSPASGDPPYLLAIAPGSPEISLVGHVSPSDLAFVADKEKGRNAA